jgi:hypothetical protein
VVSCLTENLLTQFWVVPLQQEVVSCLTENPLTQFWVVPLQQEVVSCLTENPLTQFWAVHHQQEVVSCLTEEVVNVLVQVGTTYPCQSGFSTLAAYLRKNKYRNRLNAEYHLLSEMYHL